MTSSSVASPVVFAYDGSDLAQLAIEEAGRLLETGGESLVVVVWRPIDIDFKPVGELRPSPDHIPGIRQAAEATAADGASRAQSAGFQAQGIAVEAAPTWRGITSLAEEREARLIVLGSHGHGRSVDVLRGSVARATGEHSVRPVLIVPHRP